MANHDLFGNEVKPTEGDPNKNKDGSYKKNPLLRVFGITPNEVCKNCTHFERWTMGSTWFKCALRKRGSVRTDHRANWQACGKFERAGETGAELRDKGIKAAADHANAKIPRWSEMAYLYLLKYMRTHTEFTTEDVRRSAIGIVPTPPDNRAWGAVAVRAMRARVIEKAGYTTAKNAKSHKGTCTLWRAIIT